MKKKITLLVFMLFSTVLVFGQETQKEQLLNHNADPAGRAGVAAEVESADLVPLPMSEDIFYAFDVFPGDNSVWFESDNPGTLNYLAPNTAPDFVAGACWVAENETWYGSIFGGGLYTIDKESGDMSMVGSTPGFNGLEYCDLTETMYGATGDDLYTVDMETGASTLVGPFGTADLMISIACDGNGNMYGTTVAFSPTLANLYSIDMETGAATVIASTGLQLLYAQDLAFDKDNDILYLAAYFGDGTPSGLYEIDVETADPTLIGNFQGGAEVAGFMIPYAGETYTVTFEIEDEEGDPIDDAIVTLHGVENPPGDYVFENVPAGTRDYKVEKEFYQTVEDEVTVEDDITVEVTMYPEEYTVTFDIIDDEGNPLDDAVVTLDDITNDPGDYVFDGITYGIYDYKVEKTGYGTVEDEVNVEGDITVEVILHPAITVTFDIKDEDGNEITEAVVTFDDITNDPGDYVFENIRPGTYDYKVEKEWYHTIEDEVTIEDDITVEVIMYRVTFTVEFKVEDNQQNPIENATITLGDITNPAGDYIFDETPAGNYDYKVEKTGYYDVTGNIDVYDDITLNITMIEDENYIVSHEGVELTIFPNPARDKFTVESNDIIEHIRLIKISGQVVINIAVNALHSEINISNLQPGVYFMQIHTAESVITERVQIAR